VRKPGEVIHSYSSPGTKQVATGGNVDVIADQNTLLSCNEHAEAVDTNTRTDMNPLAAQD